MKKSIVTSLTAAALATVLLAAGENNHVVKADDTNNQNAIQNAPANDSVSAATDEVTQAQDQVNDAQSKLDQAKSAAQKPDQDYNAQAAKVKTATDDVNTKQKASDDVNSKLKNAQTTADEAKKPGAIDTAKKNVDDQNQDVKDKQAALAKAQDEAKTLQANVDQANKALSDAQANLKTKEAAKAAADQKVKDAEDALKGTGIDEAKAALDKANDAEKQANEDLAIKQADLKTKSDAVAVAQAALKQAQEDAEQAQEAFNKANNDYSEKLAAKTKADQDLAAKQAEITSLTNEKKSIEAALENTINLVDVSKLRKAYRDFATGGMTGITKDDVKYFQEGFWSNGYKNSTNPEDFKKIDPNNLTDNQIEELSNFYLDLVKKLREQLGDKNHDLKVTKGSIEFAKRVQAGYIKDFNDGSWKTSSKWHDAKMINQVSEDMGLSYVEEGFGNPSRGQYYEDMQFGPGLNAHTMNDLKENIYDALRSMIFPIDGGYDIHGNFGYEMDHARGTLGFENINMDSFKPQMVAVVPFGLDSNPEDDGFPWFSMHLFNISEYDVEDPSRFDTTALPTHQDNLNQINQQLEQDAKLQSAADVAQQDLTQSEQARDTANSVLSDKTTAQNTAQAALTNATNTQRQAQDAVNTAQKVLTNAQADVKAKQGRYDTLTASNKQKAQNLKDAQAAQTQAQSDVDSASNAVKDAQNKLTQAQDAQKQNNDSIAQTQAAIKASQAKVASLTDYLNKLRNADANLKTAQDAATKAQSDLDAAKKTLADQEAALKKLEPAKTAADSAVASAESDLANAQAALKAAQDKLASAKAQEQALEEAQEEANRRAQEETNKKHATTHKQKTPAKMAKTLRLTHNAFVYTRNGHVLRHGLKIHLLRRGRHIKALKVVKIRGIKFYQIGRNQFVKAANTQIHARKLHVKATIKARKNARVRIYNENGKFIKRFVLGRHTYRFNEKRRIHGKTYYKIAGKNQWVLASKLNIKH